MGSLRRSNFGSALLAAAIIVIVIANNAMATLAIRSIDEESIKNIDIIVGVEGEKSHQIPESPEGLGVIENGKEDLSPRHYHQSSLRHSLPSRQRQRLHPLASDNHRHRYSYSPLLHLCSVLSALFPILGGELSPTKKPAVSSQHWKDLHSPEAG
ncbi:uncharacterized protein G2W53_001745 [Senna tora]|uniref:Uncharacterized protein n=1 Tax=Senna tora TaxID=362788 RepID=A0A834XG27_9FABA|nr:uncharacterized protein G2W53_001745 [Senna tora]